MQQQRRHGKSEKVGMLSVESGGWVLAPFPPAREYGGVVKAT